MEMEGRTVSGDAAQLRHPARTDRTRSACSLPRAACAYSMWRIPMRLLRSGLLLAIVAGLLAIQLAPGVMAQDDATPTAATPLASDDPLAGRLGGPLTSVIEAFG